MSLIFGPPGGLTEMNATAAEDWHQTVNRYFDRSRTSPNVAFAGSRNQFFNPAGGIAADAVELPIGWTAFPRPETIASATDQERWERAEESRDRQVEYCEWSTTRDPGGKVHRIDFTCEDPDYFGVLFRHQPETVLALYRKHVSPTVALADLQDGQGLYVSRNRWNRDTKNGAMHMIGGPNNIYAAAQLAAGASVVRTNPDGSVKTGARELILCGRYGEEERHSDPHIGSEVNRLARAGHFVALANPPQLAFESISFENWEVPGGVAPEACWTYSRGADGRYMRGVLEAPKGSAFVVGDIRIDGQPIRFGGQVADRIRIKVTGLAHKLGQAPIEAVAGCIPSSGAGGTAGASPGPEAGAMPESRLRLD